MQEKKFFIYKNQHGLLMKMESLGDKISILYFKVDENNKMTNTHVFHLLLSKEETKDVLWKEQNAVP